MRALWAMTTLAALAAAQPARAADLATLGCIRQQLPASALAEVATAAHDLADGKEALATEELQGAVAAAGQACTTLHGWSVAARDAALIHGIAATTRETLDQIAIERGVKLDALAAALAALTPAQRANFMGGMEAAANALIAQLKNQGMPTITTTQAQVIGVLALMMIIQDDSRATFVAS